MDEEFLRQTETLPRKRILTGWKEMLPRKCGESEGKLKLSLLFHPALVWGLVWFARYAYTPPPYNLWTKTNGEKEEKG